MSFKVPAASHKVLYEYKSIGIPCELAGFSVDLLEYCDDAGEFHFKEWDEKEGFIYIGRRDLTIGTRKYLFH